MASSVEGVEIACLRGEVQVDGGVARREVEPETVISAASGDRETRWENAYLHAD